MPGNSRQSRACLRKTMADGEVHAWFFLPGRWQKRSNGQHLRCSPCTSGTFNVPFKPRGTVLVVRFFLADFVSGDVAAKFKQGLRIWLPQRCPLPSPQKNAPGSKDPGARVILNHLFRPPLAETVCLHGSLLSHADGNGARPFFSLTHFVLHHLAFSQLFDRSALYFGVMEEQIVPIAFDETKTLVGQHFLNLTFWHYCLHKNLKLGQ